MEEADLLRGRLQAITEKRRIQEDIAKKRRVIEEEKLKLQYLKKKALREQWLMDGLSGQNEQEEEAMRAQAQEEQQQATVLQQQIHRWSLIKLSLKAVSFSEKWLAGVLNGQPTHCRVSFTSTLLMIQVIVLEKAKCPSN
ncbi:uncharacterized [Tachysurus ichikawai]